MNIETFHEYMHYSNQQIPCHTASTTTTTNTTILVSIIHARKYSLLLLNLTWNKQAQNPPSSSRMSFILSRYDQSLRRFEAAMGLTDDIERKKEIQKLKYNAKC